MNVRINATQLRSSLSTLVKQVGQGTRFTVFYRRRPAFQIVPTDARDNRHVPLSVDPLYGSGPLGTSQDGRTSADHDDLLYSRRDGASIGD